MSLILTSFLPFDYLIVYTFDALLHMKMGDKNSRKYMHMDAHSAQVHVHVFVVSDDE